MQCYHCNRTTEDGITVLTAPCGVEVCEDCLDAHRGCWECADELYYQRVDYHYERMREA